MKKMLISLMVGISMVAMVGCSSNEMKSHIENDTNIVEENDVIDDIILNQRYTDLGVVLDYMEGKIDLKKMKDNFGMFSNYSLIHYEDYKNITEEQRQFCLDYIDFCEWSKYYYPSDTPISEFMDKLVKIYNDNGYTGDRAVEWEEENK